MRVKRGTLFHTCLQLDKMPWDQDAIEGLNLQILICLWCDTCNNKSLTLP